ncbi:hypothetical protein PSTG_18364, partial [Puccinia striiformis f. sp. tritici PST-78]
RNYDPNGAIKGTKAAKYKIIKKLIGSATRVTTPKTKLGRGIPTLNLDKMKFNSMKCNYLYWDDPNELVERLRILLASTSAGHTNHNNEIISIIEELREANILV